MRTYNELSIAEQLAQLPQVERDEVFAGYTQDDYASLDFDWSFWGRPEQLAPSGTWDNWLILAGRGFGKTRTGAEWVRANICGDTPLTGGRWRHVALIAETAADARDVMVGDGKMLSDRNAGSTSVAAAHLSTALKAGRYPTEQITQAQQQAQDLIITLKEIIKDMQAGDPNITAFNTLITNLS